MPNDRCPCGGELTRWFPDDPTCNTWVCTVPECMAMFRQPALDGLRKMREIIDDERPYWMWHAMIEELAEQGCEFINEYGQGEECPSRGECITEWCLPCAARAFAAAEKARSK